jgi:Fic family protein
MGDYLTRIHNGLSLEEIAHIHYDFVKIHPFVDGNGRIARLLMNIALINE